MTQEEAFLILKTGANVFLTGEPGSGKTHLINRYINSVRSCGVSPSVTASTGIAATHIGGNTIHSWSGIGIRSSLTKYDIDSIGQNKNTAKRIENASVLIIDEISMLSAQTLFMVDVVCRSIRRNQEPFGGLQVVLVGDFFQLPPVFKRKTEQEQEYLIEDDNSHEKFAFQSTAWLALNPITCYLSEQHRQEDPALSGLLSAIRTKSIKKQHATLLRTRHKLNADKNATQLYSHNINVDAINSVELGKLPNQVKVFEMQSSGPERLTRALKKGCLSPESLELKIDARIMFTKNDTRKRQYMNGTLGVVIGFSKNNGCPIIKTRDGNIVSTEQEEWHIEENNRVLARITQIPLRLAWAITVHKSQGMSLDSAHMDLSGVFEYGQGYVALSRIRTIAGLSLAGINTRALEIHPDVYAKDEFFREQSKQAQEKFSKFDKKELDSLRKNFIHICGGKITSKQTPTTNTEIKIKTRKLISTYNTTYLLLKEKKTFIEIAEKRGVTISTIIGHIEKLLAEEKINPEHDLSHIVRPKKNTKIKKAFEAVYKKESNMHLSPVRAILGDDYSYDDLRLTRLFICPPKCFKKMK